MAKKKASAKKSSVKKAVKKAAPKSKSKPVKKSAPVKVAKKPAKAAVKKTVKKAVKKSAVKAPAKKTPAKKTVAKKAVAKKAAKPAANVSTNTAPAKAPAKAAPAKVVTSHLVREAKPTKVVDLSDFVTPLDDRLIVQVSAADRMTAGGLYIPDSVADTSGNLQGVVVSVGRGHISKKGHLTPMDVKLGDKIVFAQYAGTKINLQNEDLVILRESEVMGIVGK